MATTQSEINPILLDQGLENSTSSINLSESEELANPFKNVAYFLAGVEEFHTTKKFAHTGMSLLLVIGALSISDD